jgi:hypothetical protein
MRKAIRTAAVALAAALIFPAWVRSQTAGTGPSCAPSAPPAAAKADGLSQPESWVDQAGRTPARQRL